MTQLISQTYPRYFTQTSDAPYDRHHYKVHFHGGETKVVESWDEAREIWWNTIAQYTSYIEVLDIPKPKPKKIQGGFK